MAGVGFVGCEPPQQDLVIISNSYVLPSGPAFAHEPPVEALWKQEGANSFIAKRKVGPLVDWCNETCKVTEIGSCDLHSRTLGASAQKRHDPHFDEPLLTTENLKFSTTYLFGNEAMRKRQLGGTSLSA